MAPTTTKPKAEKKGAHPLVKKKDEMLTVDLIITCLGAVRILSDFGMIYYDPSTTRSALDQAVSQKARTQRPKRQRRRH